MVAYHYDFRIALVKGSPNTVAANATVLVYDPTDTGYVTPLNVYSDPALTSIVNLVSDSYGIVPDFWSAKSNLLFKSGTIKGGWATNSSVPGVQGATGPTGPTGATGPQGTPGLNGAGTNAAVAAYVTASGETRDALDARYPLATTMTTNLGTKVAKNELVINVKDYGATGDGTTDDTTAINSAVTVGAGRVVVIPKGTYMINAIANTGQGGQPTGIMVNTAGTTLRFEQGAVFQAITNTSTGYAVIQVTAADCVIDGGTVNGDMIAHAGSSGQWGHCIELAAGSDRSQVRGTRVANAWGDGVLIWGRPKDVALIGITADNNRRQGCSIIDAIRPRVIGCTFQNTGRTKLQLPGAGLDIEPDPSTTRDVIDALVSGCVFDNNAGPGFLSAGQGRTTTATVTGCRSTNNSNHGYWTTTNATGITFSACSAKSNGSSGFASDGSCVGILYDGCDASFNAAHGFLDSASTRAVATGCTASNNVAAGFYTDASSVGFTMTGCTATSNCTANATLANFDLNGATPTLSGCTSVAGANGTIPNYGYATRTGSTNAQMIGCAATGTYGTRGWFDATGAFVNIAPGDTTAGALMPVMGPKTVTTSYTVLIADGLVIANGTSITLTMPDPTTVKVGRVWTLKNINASTVTVNSAGSSKTLDGNASFTLAQWQHVQIVTNGTQWLSV
jgi:hypothetical protein